MRCWIVMLGGYDDVVGILLALVFDCVSGAEDKSSTRI